MTAAITKLADRFAETEIDDKIVLMHLDSGDFFSLTGTGVAIWHLIDGARDRAAVIDCLQAEFGASEGEIAGDVDGLLAQLRDAGLLAGG